jgi:hypothetical protein
MQPNNKNTTTVQFLLSDWGSCSACDRSRVVLAMAGFPDVVDGAILELEGQTGEEGLRLLG